MKASLSRWFCHLSLSLPNYCTSLPLLKSQSPRPQTPTVLSSYLLCHSPLPGPLLAASPALLSLQPSPCPLCSVRIAPPLCHASHRLINTYQQPHFLLSFLNVNDQLPTLLSSAHSSLSWLLGAITLNPNPPLFPVCMHAHLSSRASSNLPQSRHQGLSRDGARVLT